MSLPYDNLRTLSAELKRLAESDNWEPAAALLASLRLDKLPRAKAEDRAALQAALADIESALERATPLRDDIGRLLAAFGSPQHKT